MKNQKHAAGKPISLWIRLFLLVMLLVPSVQRLMAELSLYGTYGIHDPSTIIKDGDTYYTFGTGDGVYYLSSTDLSWWYPVGSIFVSPPAWTTNAVPDFTGFFWAPDVAFFNGKYHIYYSVSSWGTIDSAIGVVTTPSLTSPTWTDQGKVVQSDAAGYEQPETDTTAYNCIDPSILVDTDGKVWMTFGSYSSGILITEIDPATGLRKYTSSLVATQVANNSGHRGWGSSIEGAHTYKYNGYYYLFVNYGGCCSSVDSTYNIRVGRSTSVTGPYYDKDGVDMRDGGGVMLLESTGRYIGPGHAGIFQENGHFWLSHHYYDGVSNGTPTFGISEVSWGADGWPVVLGDWQASYAFDVDARDQSGIFNGTLVNGPSIVNDSERGKVLSLSGSLQHVTFPLSVGNARSFAAWVKWDGGGDWQRIFDFGADTSSYMFLTPTANTGKLRFAINNGSGEQILEAPQALPQNQWCHVAVTLSVEGPGTLYLNGEPVATGVIDIAPWSLLARNLYLGKSQFADDPYFSGRIDDFQIYGKVLSGGEVAFLAGLDSPSFTSDPFSNAGATELKAYSGQSLANYVDNPISGMTFSKVSGPDWLIVASDGTLSGTPKAADVGENTFTVRVKDTIGLPDTATMTIQVANIYNGVQGIEDLLGLSDQWLMTGCTDTPACNGADLDDDSNVTLPDFSVLSHNWLIPEDLQLWLKFDEMAGSIANDSSVYYRAGTLVGDPTWETGILGGALNFDTTNYVEVADDPNLNPDTDSFSVAFWMKSNTASQGALIVSKRQSSSPYPGYLIGLSNGTPTTFTAGSKLTFLFGADSGDRKGGYTFNDIVFNEWTHVCVVLDQDADTVYIYINGNLVLDEDMVRTPTDTLATINTTTPVYIGKNPTVSTKPYNGLVDDVRIYNVALSEQKIQTIASP